MNATCFQKRDLERTVGINTYYIGNENVELEETDINMLLEVILHPLTFNEQSVL